MKRCDLTLLWSFMDGMKLKLRLPHKGSVSPKGPPNKRMLPSIHTLESTTPAAYLMGQCACHRKCLPCQGSGPRGRIQASSMVCVTSSAEAESRHLRNRINRKSRADNCHTISEIIDNAKKACEPSSHLVRTSEPSNIGASRHICYDHFLLREGFSLIREFQFVKKG